VTIDQALHGYDHGHRLIATSTTLPNEAKQALLALTDASDVGDDPGFPALLAGFPLPGTERYAVCMTWPAQESDRPGSVWTHSLLLDTADLDRLDPGSAMSAFRRPVDADWAQYENPLSLDAVGDSPPRGDLDWISTLIWALYEAPLRPVIALPNGISSAARHDLLLSLLLQQWPSLAQRFTFAEAPRWARELDGKPFDLQITTRRGLSALRDRLEKPRVMRSPTKATPPQWAITAATRLGAPDELSSFLTDFGEEAGSERSAFGPLVEVWALVDVTADEPSAVHRLLHLVDSRFPRRGEMTHLKQSLFGPEETRRHLAKIDEAVLLNVMVGDRAARCLSIPDMDLHYRAEGLWRASSDEALAVLYATPTDHYPDLARAYAAAIAPLLDTATLNAIAVSRPDIWAVMVASSPSIVRETTLERIRASERRLLVEAIASPRATKTSQLRTLRELGRTAPPDWAETLYERFGDQITEHAEGFIQTDGELAFWGPVLPAAVLVELASRARLAPKQVLTLAEYVDRASAQLIPGSTWASAVIALSDFDVSVSPHALATLFSAAVTEPAPPADTLAATTYGRLWRLATSARATDRDAREDLLTLVKDSRESELPQAMAARLVRSFRAFRQWRAESAVSVSNDDAFAALLAYDIKHGSRQGSLPYRLAAELPVEGMTRSQYDRLQATLAKHAKKDDVLTLFSSVVRRLIDL
jgi:GTPase-associated protein 1, N-terminal domain type 1